MKQVEVAIAVIHQAGWILICQRRETDTFANLWEFPGGKLEPGESPQAAVVREVAEELGFTVKPTSAFPIIEHEYPDLSVRIHPYLCAVVDDHPRPLACQKMRWVQAEQLTNFAFPAANAQLIHEVIDRLCTCAIPPMYESAVY